MINYVPNPFVSTSPIPSSERLAGQADDLGDDRLSRQLPRQRRRHVFRGRSFRDSSLEGSAHDTSDRQARRAQRDLFWERGRFLADGAFNAKTLTSEIRPRKFYPGEAVFAVGSLFG